MKLICLIISMMVLSLNAQTVVYTQGNTKELEVSSISHTLLSFESPIIATVCHPAEVLNLDSLKESEINLPDSLSEYENKKGNKKASLAYYLKLVPKKKEGKSICSFKLADGEIFSIQFKLLDNVRKPYLSFQRKSTRIYGQRLRNPDFDLETRILFKTLLRERKIDSFRDVTPKFRGGARPYLIYSEKAVYEVLYIGKGDGFKGVVLKVQANQIFSEGPLKSKTFGRLFFSAYLKDERTFKQKISYQKRDEFYLYILASEKLTLDELKGVLL